MLSRRDFLTSSSLIALAPSVPSFLARTAHAVEPDKDNRVLVVIQLDGGNDGINTVAPYADEGYARFRNKLRIPVDRLIKLDDTVGLHPALRGAADLLERRQLAIVQGVGYPNPNRSHEVSMAIWHTASFDRDEHKSYGWIGRALDKVPRPAAGAPSSLLVGDESLPAALRGRRSASAAMASLGELVVSAATPKVSPLEPESESTDLNVFLRRATLDAYATGERLRAITQRTESDGSYPATKLARRLQLISQLIKAGFGTRVYYAVQSGYDTHYLQLPTHQELLRDLGGALRAFLDDVTAARLDDRVLVLCFSEFGRRVAENASQGTDHGTAGPAILAGSAVKAGLHGATPSLSDLADGDLKSSVDFRQVYATVLERWLDVQSSAALGASFELLPVMG
jgi:uncharacterized protein (DUF1501 family)